MTQKTIVLLKETYPTTMIIITDLGLKVTMYCMQVGTKIFIR